MPTFLAGTEYLNISFILKACAWLIIMVVTIAALCGDKWKNLNLYVSFLFDVCGRANNNCCILQPLGDQFSMNYSCLEQARHMNMDLYTYGHNQIGIDRRESLSLNEFRDVYDGKWPVIVTDIVPRWPAFQEWNLDKFQQRYGKELVVVKSVSDSLLNAVSQSMTLDSFIHSINLSTSSQWTYLEDELFLLRHLELRNDIGECVYCEEDYFKLFPKHVQPWDSMLLWGSPFSRSPLHIDPYNWSGTNAILWGHKKWKLFLPGDDLPFYVTDGQTSGFPLPCQKYNSPIDAFEPDLVTYPLFARSHVIEFDQYAGELLIIPSGWFHQAYNVEETLAVSSQMMNRNNYRVVLEEILKVEPDIRRSLSKALGISIDQQDYPEKLIGNFVKMLPRRVLEHGKQVTELVERQLISVKKAQNDN